MRRCLRTRPGSGSVAAQLVRMERRLERVEALLLGVAEMADREQQTDTTTLDSPVPMDLMDVSTWPSPQGWS